jgi:hydroxypyruvate reductase/glycerate 2-kinase
VIILIIKNYSELATTKLRKDTLDIINSGIESVLPENLLNSKVQFDEITGILKIEKKEFDIRNKRLFVIGFGKASIGMAQAVENILTSEKITAGVVISNESEPRLKSVKFYEGGHPVPDQNSLEGAKRILELKEKYSINENDLILCLVSGGGSALLTYPVENITLDDLRQTTELLLVGGVEITEFNTVRKHLSRVKGGRLGEFFKPAQVISLIISDIIDNPEDAIASGPTTPDHTTFQDAIDVLKKYDILSRVPASVKDYIESNIDKLEFETPNILDNCQNFIIGDNQIALDAMFDSAKTLGYEPLVVTSQLTGEPGFQAKKRAHYIKIGKYSDYDVLLLAGETTPILPEVHGTGGRNQQYTLASLIEMREFDGNWVLASVSTDGIDYLEDAAGAIIDNTSIIDAEEKGLDVEKYLKKYDSHTFFNELGSSLVVTGKTGTNIGDIIVYILKKNDEEI